MDFIVEDNRIYLKGENGKIIAEIDFEQKEYGVYNIFHTFVDESLRGQGVASKLIQKAVEEIKKRGGKTEATCSYAKKWIENNKKLL